MRASVPWVHEGIIECGVVDFMMASMFHRLRRLFPVLLSAALIFRTVMAVAMPVQVGLLDGTGGSSMAIAVAAAADHGECVGHGSKDSSPDTHKVKHASCDTCQLQLSLTQPLDTDLSRVAQPQPIDADQAFLTVSPQRLSKPPQTA